MSTARRARARRRHRQRCASNIVIGGWIPGPGPAQQQPPTSGRLLAEEFGERRPRIIVGVQVAAYQRGAAACAASVECVHGVDGLEPSLRLECRLECRLAPLSLHLGDLGYELVDACARGRVGRIRRSARKRGRG